MCQLDATAATRIMLTVTVLQVNRAVESVGKVICRKFAINKIKYLRV
jgi:hypothetical protein